MSYTMLWEKLVANKEVNTALRVVCTAESFVLKSDVIQANSVLEVGFSTFLLLYGSASLLDNKHLYTTNA